MNTFLRTQLLGFSLLMIVACNGDKNRAPTAESLVVAALEDGTTSWSLRGTDPEGTKVAYRVLNNPNHGTLEVDVNTGAFLYSPESDYFGIDTFSYSVSDGKKSSLPALVTMVVENINDPPTLAPIPDLQNSAESDTVRYALEMHDVDDEQLTFSVTSDDPDIATAEIDPSSRSLVISWHNYGETDFQVNVSDQRAGALGSFRFTVRDVTKVRSIRTTPADAIVLSNTTNAAVAFRLGHNGFPMFQSDAEIVEFVRAMPSEFDAEPFERKLWRFVRDNVYHAVPIDNYWSFNPWVTVNSLGWGLCGQVADTYMRLARSAGYSARMWGLGPHVVPEILIGDRWQLYDPDLAIYYRNRNGQIAGVEELAEDPTLVTSPVEPIIDIDVFPYGYSSIIADAYSNTSENVATSVNSQISPSNYRMLTLPPGAALTYPVRLVDQVEGLDGTLRFPVPHFLQAELTVSGAWTGELEMPWILWNQSGDGVVAIDDVEFAVGSAQLTDRIRGSTKPITSVRVVQPGVMRFGFFINALNYQLSEANEVRLTGLHPSGIEVGITTPPLQQLAPWNGASPQRKIRGRR